jgi:hypothetical protein
VSDLFGFLNSAVKGDFAAVDRMSDDEVKKMPPVVLLMWCHGARSNTEARVVLTNTYCNPYVFKLYKHPRLLLKLFVQANSAMGDTRFSFVKSVTKEESALNRQIALHYDCSLREAKQIKNMLSDDDIAAIKDLYPET